MEPVRMLELKTCQCRYRAAGNCTTEEVQTFKQLAISLFTLLSYTPLVVALHVTTHCQVRVTESQRVTRSVFAMLEMFDLNLVILFLVKFMQLEIY